MAQGAVGRGQGLAEGGVEHLPAHGVHEQVADAVLDEPLLEFAPRRRPRSCRRLPCRPASSRRRPGRAGRPGRRRGPRRRGAIRLGSDRTWIASFRFGFMPPAGCSGRRRCSFRLRFGGVNAVARLVDDSGPPQLLEHQVDVVGGDRSLESVDHLHDAQGPAGGFEDLEPPAPSSRRAACPPGGKGPACRRRRTTTFGRLPATTR